MTRFFDSCASLKRYFQEPGYERGLHCHCPSLPECVTDADTLEVARQMNQEAILLYLESLMEKGLFIPGEQLRSRFEALEVAV